MVQTISTYRKSGRLFILREMAWSIKGDVKKILLPRPEGGGISATSSPFSLRKTLVWCSCPWIGSALFHLSSCIFVSSDDADRFQKLSKPCDCTVSTMGLSEARGLMLFRVIRGGIGVTRRLGATGTVSSTGHSHTHPRTRASQRTDWPPPEKITGDGRALHPRRSSGLRF